MRRFAGEWLALQQSGCYRQGGATCITCHNPHNNRIAEDARLKGGSNELCGRCHEEIARNVTKMSHHAPESEGSRCVNCHMPYTTNMIKTKERDHNISIPAPENTVRHGIPNACNACHADRSADWALAALDRWFPNRPKTMARRADALVRAKKRDPAAIEPLIGLMLDASENTTIRASAAGFLGEFRDARVSRALARALTDRDVLVRAEAARSLGEAGDKEALPALEAALTDLARIVRVHAAFSLLKLGVVKLEGERAAAFEKTKREYREFLTSFPDQVRNRIDLGTYEALHGRYNEALANYRAAGKLNPASLEARYYIGVASASLERWNDALASFRSVLREDPSYRNTRELAARVEQILGRRN
jgi:predicted CXXCH cytochrome family protein